MRLRRRRTGVYGRTDGGKRLSWEAVGRELRCRALTTGDGFPDPTTMSRVRVESRLTL